MAGKKTKQKKAAKKLDFANLEPAAVLCPICRTVLIEPVTLPCDHAFCRQCFEGTMENANLSCPLCRLRVGSWFRRAKKEGTVIDKEFWKAVQQQYPLEIRNKRQGIDNDIEKDKPIIIVANQGEIRKEYERERQKDLDEQKKIKEVEEKASAVLIQKIREEEEYKRQVEEEKLRLDALLAKKLAEELNAPSTSKATPRKPTKSLATKQYGPMDRFIKTDDRTPIRRLSHKNFIPHKPNPTKLNKLSDSPNIAISKQHPGKEYTCHVLPVEQCSVRVNRSNNLFADLDFKGILGTLGQKATKGTDLDRRKSICTSGYKSSASGDNSDVIDQECRFYFKPIDSQRRHHVRGKIPVKIPAVLGVNEGNVPIVPPSGKLLNLPGSESAFARFPGDWVVPSSDLIEGETSPELKTVKRGAVTQTKGPLRKKGRRQIFAPKKNYLMKSDGASPFYGFNNESERVVDISPFYGFDTLHLEESQRESEVVNRLVSKFERTLLDPRVIRLRPDQAVRNHSEGARKLIDDIIIGETDIDINRNIPKNDIRIGDGVDSSHVISSTDTKIVDLYEKEDYQTTNLDHNHLDSASYINGHVDIPSSVANASESVNCINTLGSGKLAASPSDFDSDSEDEVLSKLIDSLCNPSRGDSPVTKRKKCSPKKSPPKKSSEATQLEPTSLNNQSKVVKMAVNDSKPVDNKVWRTCVQKNRSDPKITDTFSKVKNSPPKNKSSPRKGKSNVDFVVEQKRLQEETDFELAKKLQAEFDLIQAQSRTRRGTKRQITLDEMLAV